MFVWRVRNTLTLYARSGIYRLELSLTFLDTESDLHKRHVLTLHVLDGAHPVDLYLFSGGSVSILFD